jgi:hypothetical protein
MKTKELIADEVFKKQVRSRVGQRFSAHLKLA